jgi:hypothetical protein
MDATHHNITNDATSNNNFASNHRSCIMQSYSIDDNATNHHELGDNVPFHLIERGNYTIHDMYQHAYHTTIRNTTRSLALACTIGILAAFLQILLIHCNEKNNTPNSIFRKLIWKQVRRPSQKIRFCLYFGLVLFVSSVTSFSISMFLFSMIWIVHHTALFIMIPLAIVSFIAMICLYYLHFNRKSSNNDNTGTNTLTAQNSQS